ncbi:cupin-like domain-containing protein [Pseudomonas sp. Leaf129]|uniref:cupin-like domain-containing protein n=1 Tax=Pseudomonas sp. Leaf129 TaxID=1736268 RepID=UPI0009ECBF26|nr:cupin-like domain-containing protein [Pseudomonas sp. Leaf129]
MNIIDLEVLHTSHKSDLTKSIEQGVPIIVNGLASCWPGARWNFDVLRKKIGHKEVKALIDLPTTGGELDGGHERYEKIMRFQNFIDLAHDEAARPCYLGYIRSNEFLDDFDKDFLFESITNSYPGDCDTRLWIGSKGTCSGLHSDLKDNIFLQVYGFKTVYLVPFEDTPYVYPYIDNIVNSRIDCESYSPELFPKFKKARVYKGMVSPGDMMFIPKGWWHYLKSSTPSISVNHWFGYPVPGGTYCKMLVRLGPKYIARTLRDMFVYSLMGRQYRKEFFFTPQSTGERFFNYLVSGDFSKENDPVNLQGNRPRS